MQPVEFLGFAADCTISGKVTMFGERLTDFLNGQERFRVHHVECESLTDGHRVEVDSISVERNDLLRGDGDRAARLGEAARLAPDGPAPGLRRAVPDPRPPAHEARRGRRWRASSRRDAMIPFTNATIAYEVAGSIVARDVSTIIVNRLLVDWISPTTETATLFPDVPVRSPFASRLHQERGRGA